ncbi:uncharacterized protein LOC125678575 isoform X2 [Ostrea edulis]|uniref:uncharacterized protein LOC125678575 isoform X2 n=1 Tax=Ostrea edulis TaxID=37623 RepID=UPI0024AF8603|nr:uncharacterized protein LOC125678575 isoform X2 [Ostrea edulis]
MRTKPDIVRDGFREAGISSLLRFDYNCERILVTSYNKKKLQRNECSLPLSLCVAVPTINLLHLGSYSGNRYNGY